MFFLPPGEGPVVKVRIFYYQQGLFLRALCVGKDVVYTAIAFQQGPRLCSLPIERRCRELIGSILVQALLEAQADACAR